jgi:valyl-tRNA synthetase
MLVALSTLLRLFAPYLPFVTEEVWSWWRPGSVHRAPWPVADEVVAPIQGNDPQALMVRDATQVALTEVRRIKSVLKKPVKSVIASAVLPRAWDGLLPASRDFQAATHIRTLAFGDVSEPRLEFAEEATTSGGTGA